MNSRIISYEIVPAFVLLSVMFALQIGAAIYFYRFVRDVFYTASCSKEEFAKGSIFFSRITGLILATEKHIWNNLRKIDNHVKKPAVALNATAGF